jgi:exonuclease 3'-5' domain-containing protein 1
MSTPEIISTLPSLHTFLSSINPSTTLYLDLEGTNLGRHGTISIITALLQPQNTSHLIDILTLGEQAFTSAPQDGGSQTLQSILESPSIKKILWDVRADADALFALYNVRLAGVFDLQLLEILARPQGQSRKYVRGLNKCIEYGLPMDMAQKAQWLAIKQAGRAAMDAARDGGGENGFVVRPMAEGTVQYCVNDVLLLPGLAEVYLRRFVGMRLSGAVAKVKAGSEKRLEEARSTGFVAGARDNALSPWKDE